MSIQNKNGCHIWPTFRHATLIIDNVCHLYFLPVCLRFCPRSRPTMWSVWRDALMRWPSRSRRSTNHWSRPASKPLRWAMQTLGSETLKESYIHWSGLDPAFQNWVSKNTHLGWIGCPILFHPTALYTKYMDIRVSKISNGVSIRHPDTTLAKDVIYIH